jgi:Tfp pilus assembly major pilin PilA
MIVVTIIAILAGLAIPAFQKVAVASQNSRLANDLRRFGHMMDVFIMDTGTYP